MSVRPTDGPLTWNVAGLHLYTFNEVERTERWRRRMLDELAGR